MNERSNLLNMWHGNVWHGVLPLGHNGAGKTTTMSMITGLYPPSSGTALVMGYDITENVSAAQSSLGICPQHDVLFDTLTVQEHLQFFCQLKGVETEKVQGMVDDMIASLKLEEKRHAQTSTLSGGQKRRLSCGIAIVGGSKVVILDEPTSGMDPAARRATWDLITKYKEGRTILLSTHFMDEADILGDRVAIMATGEVRCCGSSLFLKRKFGRGYSLVMAKLDGCDANTVLEFIQQNVPDAELNSNIGTELSFLLPRESSGKFGAFFEKLEQKKDALCVASYGCSITTLEEVFLTVGKQVEEGEALEALEALESGTTPASSFIYEDEALDDDPLLTNGSISSTPMKSIIKTPNMQQQFSAMLTKRMKNSFRNKITAAIQLVPPLLFTLLALITTQEAAPQTVIPARNLADLSSSYGSHNIWLANVDGSEAVANATSFNFPNTSAATVRNVPMADVASDQDVTNFLVQQAGTTVGERYVFNRESPLLLQISATEIVGWFNGQPYHAVSEALNAVDSVIFSKWTAEQPGGEMKGFASLNEPLPLSLDEQIQNQQSSFIGFNLAFSILFGMAFVVSSFLLFVVQERETKAKHVQFVSGVSPISYWLSAYLWDLLNFVVPVLGIFILFFAWDIKAYIIDENLGVTILIFALYGLSALPLMYLASFFFTEPSTAFVRMSLFNIVTGLAAMLAVTIMSAIPSTQDAADTLRHLLLFLPNYCFGQALSDLYVSHPPIRVSALYMLSTPRSVPSRHPLVSSTRV